MDLFDFVVLTVIVILLPLVADLLNGMFPHAKIGRIAQRVVGYVLVFFIASLILVAFYLWYSVYFPYLVMTRDLEASSLVYHLNVFTCVFLVFTILFYYYMAITTTSFMKIQPINNNKSGGDGDSSSVGGTSKTQQCKHCNANKSTSSRSYHCRICKRCTGRMDHHCPFIANCCMLSWASHTPVIFHINRSETVY
ncbi:DHHC-type zinc finger-containing protein [Cavenderia fasciculata]|uniref:Palmitoyltransferase n=1 Tax=Cavenderia fasciculata TaxID=261658 RepID=F4PVV8_CACFS|nr:DHHC-type zinc finger-containing protein [Cavenderia fasciculata]EGG20122.1 DHHC-type zinc finger-containing protein [Cavenderia fasciculata]|eukprot:XP_004367105.1 DHHC-type zinc finger-containing protein [Cavenderia fasciculata]